MQPCSPACSSSGESRHAWTHRQHRQHSGPQGYAYVSAYVAAKHGVVGLTKALALELARKSVTVNAICPGYTETDIVREAVR